MAPISGVARGEENGRDEKMNILNKENWFSASDGY